MRLDTGGAADTGDSAGVDAAGLLRAPLGRLRRRWAVCGVSGPLEASRGALLWAAHRCPGRPTAALDAPSTALKPSAALRPAVALDGAPLGRLRRRWAVCGVSGPLEASRGALLWAAHRRSERPTAALEAPSTALKPSAALRPAVALDGAPLGRLRHRWAVCGVSGPPEASRGALLWAAHRCPGRPTAALDAPSGLMCSPPTMAAPAFPSSSPPERCRRIAVEASGSDRQANRSGDEAGGVDETGSTGPVTAHSARLSGLEPAEPPGLPSKNPRHGRTVTWV